MAIVYPQPLLGLPNGTPGQVTPGGGAPSPQDTYMHWPHGSMPSKMLTPEQQAAVNGNLGMMPAGSAPGAPQPGSAPSWMQALQNYYALMSQQNNASPAAQQAADNAAMQQRLAGLSQTLGSWNPQPGTGSGYTATATPPPPTTMTMGGSAPPPAPQQPGIGYGLGGGVRGLVQHFNRP